MHRYAFEENVDDIPTMNQNNQQENQNQLVNAQEPDTEEESDVEDSEPEEEEEEDEEPEDVENDGDYRDSEDSDSPAYDPESPVDDEAVNMNALIQQPGLQTPSQSGQGDDSEEVVDSLADMILEDPDNNPNIQFNDQMGLDDNGDNADA